MKFGIPTELTPGEKRVATTPDVAKKLVAGGLEVLLERGAGAAAHFTDEAFVDVGVQLVDAAAIWSCDIVAKVRKPTLEEAERAREGGVLICLAEACGEDEITSALHARKVTTLAMERVPRISRAQSMDALSSQSNIAGYRAVIEAAAHFGRFVPLMMTSAGSSLR